MNKLKQKNESSKPIEKENQNLSTIDDDYEKRLHLLISQISVIEEELLVTYFC